MIAECLTGGCDQGDGGNGGGVAAKWLANCGTCAAAAQAGMPAVQTSESALTSPRATAAASCSVE
jgi:hypothetical protein